MNISEIAIKRPVFTVMVTFALMVFGLLGLSRLGTDLFPDVAFPVVTVVIAYPGASPNEVETLVTKQVEDVVVSLNGLDRVRTLSREGVSTTMIIFKLGVDLKTAASDVRDRIAQIRAKLPEGSKEPAISRLDVSAAPILTYTLSGGGRSLAETGKLARDVIKPALEQVDGVAAVDVTGGPEREIHVELNLAKLDALKLSPVAILNKLKGENLTVPAGHFDEGTREISVRTVGEFRDVEDIRNVIVANTPDGSGVRLSEIAEVEDTYEELRMRPRSNGEDAVALQVVKQSGRNTVEVADAFRAKLEQVEKTLPEGVRAHLIVDQSKYIRENAEDVEKSIVFGGAMAILVILIFMLDLRSMLISSVALPTSVISTFFMMYLLGFTLNMMTLLGLSLAIGLLIDDAVVVRENISKFLERGVDPKTAALEGTKEISLSVLATTMTVVAVFLPVAFMDGMVGQFFRQFGLTIVGAVLMSLFVAFTLDPMLSSRFSKAHKVGAHDSFAWLKAPFEAVHSATQDTYTSILGWAVRHRFLVILGAVLSFVGMIVITGLMGSDFVNPEDRGQFVVEIELPAGTTLEETARLSLEPEKRLLADKRFVTVYTLLGVDDTSNKLRWRIITVPKSQRTAKIDDLKAIARKEAQSMPDAKVAVTDPAFVEGAGTQAPIMVDVRASSYSELEPLARQFTDALHAIPGVIDVQMNYTPGRPELRVGIDRDKAARAQVPVSQVASTLRASIEGDEGSKLRQG